MMSLAVDIGGTYSRLAWLDDGTALAFNPTRGLYLCGAFRYFSSPATTPG
jgi:hypothetical protein